MRSVIALGFGLAFVSPIADSYAQQATPPGSYARAAAEAAARRASPILTMLEPKSEVEANTRNETFRTAVSDAVRTNPRISVAQAGAARAGEAVSQAFAGLLPQVDLSLTGAGTQLVKPSSRYTFRADPTRSDATLSIRQLLWDFGATFDRVSAAEYGAAAAAADSELSIINQTLRSVFAYYDVIRWRSKLMLAQQDVRQHEDITRKVLDRVAAGVGSFSDQARAESRLAEAHSKLTATRGELERAEASYRELFGDAPAEIKLPTQHPQVPPSANDAIEVAISQSPTLRRARASTQSSEYSRDATHAENLPKLVFDIEGTRYDVTAGGSANEPYEVFARLRLSYALFTGGAATSRERQADFQAAQAKYEEDSIRLELDRNIRFAYAELQARQQRLRTLELGLRANTAAVEAYQEQYLIGRRSLLDLLDAQKDMFDAGIALIDGRLDLDLAIYAIAALDGSLLSFFNLDHVPTKEMP